MKVNQINVFIPTPWYSHQLQQTVNGIRVLHDRLYHYKNYQ